MTRQRQRRLDLGDEPPAPPPKDLPIKGSLKAPVLVICDPPKEAWEWSRADILPGNQMKVFAKAAQACGFKEKDFIFALPCPPIPTEIENSDKKIVAFVEPYRERYLELLEDVKPRLVIYMGKWAGRLVTGRPIQIMKARGAFTKEQYPGVGSVPVLPMISARNVLARPEQGEIFSTDFMMAGKLKDNDWKLGKVFSAGGEVKKNYRWCLDIQDLLDNPPPAASIDTETTGLKWFLAGTKSPEAVKVLTVQICVAPGDVRVCPVDCDYYPDLKPKQRKKLVGQIKQFCEMKKMSRVSHNAKYDTHVMREDLGINIQYTTDTQLLAFLIDENMQEKSLDECTRRWVPDMAGYNDQNNKKIDKENMRECPHELMLPYGGGDADAAFRLAAILTPLARQDKAQWNCYRRIIFPAIEAFCDPVELYGVKVNSKKLAELQFSLAAAEKEMFESLITQVPGSIKRAHVDKGLKFSRADFLIDILFRHKDGLRLKPKVYTDSTKNEKDPKDRVPSVSTKTHLPYFIDEPFVAELMEYIKLQKLRNTYVGLPYDEKKKGPSGFWQYINQGEIHPSFMLHRTVTGRTASASPNGQNFPKRGKGRLKDVVKAYREIFIARNGYTLIETDLSQAELRIAAWMAMEKTMLKIYREGGDIHAMTAARTMGISLKEFMALPEDVIEQKRFEAKAVNFGFLFAMGWRKFKAYAKTDYGIDFTDEEAQELRRVFFELYPGLVDWHKKMRSEVKAKGKVRALHGAARHLPSIYSEEEYIRSECERQAINSPVQRFASDLGLIAMVRLVRDADPEIIRPIMFVHDSLVIEVKNEYLEDALEWVKFYMESPPLGEWFDLEPPLPIIADVGYGPNLGKMEKAKKIKAIAPDWYQPELDAA